MASKRNTLTIDHHHPLRSFAPFGFADSEAPFLAGAKLPSTKAFSQSRRPCSSSCLRNVRQISSHIPCSSNDFRRRQQVDGWGYRSGRSFHLAPVRSIHKIPSNTSRSSALGRPPWRLTSAFGRSGSIFSHCSSVKYSAYRLIGSPPISLYVKSKNKYKNILFNYSNN